jgi:outer membrane receptor protein involved in Fe transport
VGLTFVSATPSQGTCVNTPPVTCSLGAIAGGGNASVTIVATAPSAATYVNSASVTATETDQDSSNNAASVTTIVTNQTRNADVSVTKAGTRPRWHRHDRRQHHLHADGQQQRRRAQVQ